MSDAEGYSIVLKRLEVDGEIQWRATVRELPDVIEFADTSEDAQALAYDAIETLKTAASESGRSFPEPIEDLEDYSGRITLRMPPSLHRQLAIFAERDDSSLNQYIVTVLSAAVGKANADICAIWGSPPAMTTHGVTYAFGTPMHGFQFDSATTPFVVGATTAMLMDIGSSFDTRPQLPNLIPPGVRRIFNVSTPTSAIPDFGVVDSARKRE